jgi:hypothetical protein
MLKRSENTDIACVRQQLKRPKITHVQVKPKAKAGRHVIWDPSTHYTLVRKGKPIKNEGEAGELFSSDAIDESYFYLFKHVDAKMPRNQVTPVYEAVYFCTEGGYYIRVQKRYLKRAYTKMQRCDKSQMWSVLEDQTPYWVDRHAFCKQGQRESKKRYQQQQTSKK